MRSRSAALLTCSDDGVRPDPFQLFLRCRRPVHLLHADGRRRPVSQAVQLDVGSQLLQDAAVTVAEDESVRAAGATDGDAGQPHAAAQLQHRPAARGRRREENRFKNSVYE